MVNVEKGDTHSNVKFNEADMPYMSTVARICGTIAAGQSDGKFKKYLYNRGGTGEFQKNVNNLFDAVNNKQFNRIPSLLKKFRDHLKSFIQLLKTIPINEDGYDFREELRKYANRSSGKPSNDLSDAIKDLVDENNVKYYWDDKEYFDNSTTTTIHLSIPAPKTEQPKK